MSKYPPCPGYELLELLVCGGGQLIIQARQKETRRMVRLNLVHGSGTFGQQVADHLRHEADVLGSLDHPNIIRVVETGEAQGYGFFMATEPADIQDVVMLNRLKRLEHREVLGIMHSVAAALDYAHGRNIFHGDIHPRNILVDRTGCIYLDGFGKTDQSNTKEGVIFGNPHYMAPERIVDSHGISPKTDVYGLASAVFLLLSGCYPFQGGGLELVERKCSSPPPAIRALQPDLPRGVDRVLQRGMALNPDDRFRSPGQFAEALSRALGGQEGKPKWWRWW